MPMKYYTAEQKKKHINDYQSSGMSLKEYCFCAEVSPSTLETWLQIESKNGTLLPTKSAMAPTSRKNNNPMTEKRKTCRHCGRLFQRRRDERPSQYIKRVYCHKECKMADYKNKAHEKYLQSKQEAVNGKAVALNVKVYQKIISTAQDLIRIAEEVKQLEQKPKTNNDGIIENIFKKWIESGLAKDEKEALSLTLSAVDFFSILKKMDNGNKIK